MDEKCKDCVYVSNLDKRVEKIEIRMEKIETEVNKQSIENAETKIYYQNILNILDKMDKEITSLKQAIQDVKTNVWTKFSEAPWSMKVLVYVLGALAGLRLLGFDLATLLK
jgi:archaellum component FlaC